MAIIDVEQLTITDNPGWKKWPHTQDTDFSNIEAVRLKREISDAHNTIRVTERFYPAFSAYAKVGNLSLPCPPGIIDNTKLPPSDVLEQQVRDLTALSKECQALYWHTAYQGFPYVADKVCPLFQFKLLSFGDDCPGSSEIKTFPIARHFNALIHAMGVWSMDTGEFVSTIYRRLGIPDIYQTTAGCTTGLLIALDDTNFDVEDKIAKIGAGARFENDLVFIGARTQRSWRSRFISRMNKVLHGIKSSGLNITFKGAGMPDGLYQPATHPKGIGYPVGLLYTKTHMGVNLQLSGLFNARLMDLWRTATPQMIYDPHGEMQLIKAEPMEHFIPFDGTPEGLLATFKKYRTEHALLAHIARNGVAQEKFVRETMNFYTVMNEVFLDHTGLL